jgi:GTP-binding protein YchF
VPTTIEIVDIAGLVKGASKGEGLGNQFLANIRATNAIIHVLRCFDDDNVIHVDGSVDPIRDKEIIDTELQLKDLDSIEKKISKVEKMAKTGGDKEAKKTFDVLTVYKNHLLSGKSARTAPIAEEDKEYIADIWLLTAKPVMYVCNVEESAVNTGNAYVEKVKAAVKEENAEVLIISAQIESEIAQLESYEERQMFLEDLGLTGSGVNKLIKAAYKLLNLATYFTAGVQEVRAWTITKGFTAPQAAGVIHTDFEKGFIRAEVIKYEDFVKFNGSEAVIKDNGKLAVEGKTYIVQDGDIMHFRFNV